MSVGDELEFINHLELTEREQLIAGRSSRRSATVWASWRTWAWTT